MSLHRSSRALLWISAAPLLLYPFVAWPVFEYFTSLKPSLNEWWFTGLLSIFGVLVLAYPVSWNLFRIGAIKYAGQKKEQLAAYGALGYVGVMLGLGATMLYFLTISINALLLS